jgi:hypothetical protein
MAGRETRSGRAGVSILRAVTWYGTDRLKDKADV